MGASKLGQILVDEGIIQEYDRKTLRQVTGHVPAAFAKGVLSLGLFNDEQLATFLAECTNFDRVGKHLLEEADLDVMAHIDSALMARLEFIPLKLTNGILHVAMVDPLDRGVINQIEFFCGYKVKPYIATASQIKLVLEQLVHSYEPQTSPFDQFLAQHIDTAAFHHHLHKRNPNFKADNQAEKRLNDTFDELAQDSLSTEDSHSFDSLATKEDSMFDETIDLDDELASEDLSSLDLEASADIEEKGEIETLAPLDGDQAADSGDSLEFASDEDAAEEEVEEAVTSDEEASLAAANAQSDEGISAFDEPEQQLSGGKDSEEDTADESTELGGLDQDSEGLVEDGYQTAAEEGGEEDPFEELSAATGEDLEEASVETLEEASAQLAESHSETDTDSATSINKTTLAAPELSDPKLPQTKLNIDELLAMADDDEIPYSSASNPSEEEEEEEALALVPDEVEKQVEDATMPTKASNEQAPEIDDLGLFGDSDLEPGNTSEPNPAEIRAHTLSEPELRESAAAVPASLLISKFNQANLALHHIKANDEAIAVLSSTLNHMFDSAAVYTLNDGNPQELVNWGEEPQITCTDDIINATEKQFHSHQDGSISFKCANLIITSPTINDSYLNSKPLARTLTAFLVAVTKKIT